jgi:hypothetical protein
LGAALAKPVKNLVDAVNREHDVELLENRFSATFTVYLCEKPELAALYCGTEHRETLPRIVATGINKSQTAASSL